MKDEQLVSIIFDESISRNTSGGGDHSHPTGKQR